MNITNFKIKEDKTQLNLTITNASTITSLLLWKDDTYKDYAKAIDLTSKLTGSNTENIIITPSDLTERYFSGIYFIEASNNELVAFEFSYDLTRYKECIINKIRNLAAISNCDDCLKSQNIPVINAESIFRGLNYALESRYINEILQFTRALNKYCDDDCKGCGPNLLDIKYHETGNDMDDLIVTVDGGEIEIDEGNNNPDDIIIMVDGGEII